MMELADYIFIMELIDTMSERGAFKGIELYPVGLLRMRVQETINGIERETEEHGVDGEVPPTDDQ